MNHQANNFILVKNIQYYNFEINFAKKLIKQSQIDEETKKNHYKNLQRAEKTLKIIKKQIKELKLTDFQINEIFYSTFTFIQNTIQQVILPYRMIKTDLQIFIQKKQFIQSQNTVGISKKIQTNHFDDRLLTQIDLTQVFDIQYHQFSLYALKSKSSQILQNFKYHEKVCSANEQDLFIKQIIKNYHIIPYHNFTHAFSVFSIFYQIYHKSQIFTTWINDFELYFSLIACLCHDVKHNGYNTMFEAKCKSQIAVHFGNISIMQKMHNSVTFSILQHNKRSPFLFLTDNQKKYAKKIITRCILATDMSKHYDYVSILQQKDMKAQNQQSRLLFMQILIHGCDIGNSMLDYDNYIIWANLVCVQFHDQTIQEQNCGIQPTEHLKFDSLNYFYKNQNTFINGIVLPLWTNLADLINDNNIKQKCKIIKQNGSKVSDHMRRNTTNPSKVDLSKLLLNLVKVK